MLTAWLLPLPFALLFTDFLSGIFHWLEDSYGDPNSPIIGKYVIAPNVLHHFDPRAFTKSPVWRRNRSLWVVCALVMLAVWAAGAMSPFWLYVGIFGAVSNEIHVWSHRTPGENGALISALQRWRIVQTPRRHAVHHTDPKRSSFCVMTNLVNPVLDATRFFRGLEWLIANVLGIPVRLDESVGPGRGEARARLYGSA